MANGIKARPEESERTKNAENNLSIHGPGDISNIFCVETSVRSGKLLRDRK